jgi:hypothetical protein
MVISEKQESVLCGVVGIMVGVLLGLIWWGVTKG